MFLNDSHVVAPPNFYDFIIFNENHTNEHRVVIPNAEYANTGRATHDLMCLDIIFLKKKQA